MNSIPLKSKPISHILLSNSKSPQTPSKLFCISFFSNSSSTPSSYPNNPPSSSRRRHEEESKNVRVSVWWDIENCSVPTGINVFKIPHFITSAVRVNGIKGPVQVTAFGNILNLSRVNQEALSSTGVNLVHIPQGGKNSADRSLLMDLMHWISENPPPAHVFLISGDRDFSGILHKLRMNNYNILLAGREGITPSVLCSAASIMWQWHDLVRGENLSGRHFNQPPDGPFNSWYGNYYKGPLEDPYVVFEQNSSAEADNMCNAELSSESKRHPVPMAVLRQLHRIVNAYPEGLTVNELQSAMTKCKLHIDKNFYGYKKLSRFLQSFPHIVKVESYPDGQFYLRPVPKKKGESMEADDNSLGLMTEKKASTITRMMDVEPQLPVSPYVTHGEITTEDKEKKKTPVTSENRASYAPQGDNQVTSSTELSGKGVFKAEVFEIPVPPKEEQNSKSKVGLRLECGEGAHAMETNSDIPGSLNLSSGSTEMSTHEEETNSTNQHVVQHPTQSSSTALNEDVKSNKCDEFEPRVGLLTRVISWFRSWTNSSVKTPIEQSSEEPGFTEENLKKFDDGLHSKKPELFSKEAFWRAFKSFLRTRRGSDIVSSATSRDQLAVRLQTEGPLVLRPLKESDLHYLVDLLFSNNLIAEFPTKIPRFRIVHAPVRSSPEHQPQEYQPHSTNGLSSLFTGSSPQENPQSRVISAVHKKSSGKSRSEILADCQTLLDDLLSQNPGGFNMCVFKKNFLDKYGYALDHHTLGYPKLVSLLQIMPGVKIESSHISSDKVVFSPDIESLGVTDKSSGSDSDSPQKNKERESPWEDPVAKQERELSTPYQANGTYEPSVSDDDEFSELEEDSTSSQHPIKAEDQTRSGTNGEDSSLLHFLDSWSRTNNSRHQGSQAKGLNDSANKESDSTESSNTSVKTEPAGARNERPQRSYTFVANHTENKDALIDGILGSLKTSRESKMQQ